MPPQPLLRMARWILEQPFGACYWAFTFGATALAGAATRLSIVDPASAIASLALPLFVAANLLVAVIAAGTVRLLALKKLLPPAPSSVVAAGAR